MPWMIPALGRSGKGSAKETGKGFPAAGLGAGKALQRGIRPNSKSRGKKLSLVNWSPCCGGWGLGGRFRDMGTCSVFL